MYQPVIKDVSNPAAYGAEWESETGSRYQLVTPRGGSSLTMGVLPWNKATWTSTSVSSPERFGPWPPNDHKAFMAVARRFVYEASGGQQPD